MTTQSRGTPVHSKQRATYSFTHHFLKREQNHTRKGHRLGAFFPPSAPSDVPFTTTALLPPPQINPRAPPPPSTSPPSSASSSPSRATSTSSSTTSTSPRPSASPRPSSSNPAPAAPSSSPASASPASSPTRSPRPSSPSASAPASCPPVDALHGDIGILADRDVLVLFSKSGNTEELLRLVPCARAKGAFLISVTSAEENLLKRCCDMNVYLPLERELCPFDLAPVTSTAIQMVFGDTVAIALMGARNLSKEAYAANHPAGRIGKTLIFKVKDVMKQQNELPVCREGDLIMDQLVELTSKGCGCLLVIDEGYHLIGTFTDGDLRRTLKSSGEGIFKLTVGEMCNRNPRTIGPDAMAVEAMEKMESPPSPVQFLPVIDHQNVLIGIVTLHGLVSAGL
ncbi:hypothetical protein NL676_002820 [Syzygium grande]|nr:hypothetical protein NL676_002820 [Syzygium grande]